MTNEEINEAVARKLGWRHDPEDGLWKHPNPNDQIQWYDLSNYCGDLKAAWEIAQHVVSRGIDFDLFRTLDLDGRMDSNWTCRIAQEHEGQAESAPMAICKAFLGLKGLA